MTIELSEEVLLVLRMVQAMLDQEYRRGNQYTKHIKKLRIRGGSGDETHSMLFHIEGEFKSAGIRGAVHLNKQANQEWSEGEAWASLKLGNTRYFAELKHSGKDLAVRVFDERPDSGGQGEAVAIVQIKQLSTGGD